MFRDFTLPSGETIEVEFTYENLQKHCFRCYSLGHEKDACPLVEESRERDRSPHRLSTSQKNTMASLDENRRKYEERRNGKSNQNRQMRESSSTFSKTNYYEDRRTDPRHNSRRNQSYEPFTSEYRRGREDYNLGRSFSRESGARTGINPRNSDFPSPIPHSTDLRRALSRRDEGEVSAEQVSSGRRPIKERLMLADNTHSTDLRRSLTVRDNGGGSGGPSLADRPPVKQRLSLPSNGKALRMNQGTSTGSSHLQDIVIQYFEEIMEPPRLSNNRPSGSRPPGTLHSPMEQISPIRSLSEDRRHVTLRLGPQPVENQQNSPIQAGLSDGQGIVTRSVAKRKEGKAPPKKRYNPSPVVIFAEDSTFEVFSLDLDCFVDLDKDDESGRRRRFRTETVDLEDRDSESERRRWI
ncbi:hypothetical protein IGI04_015706 [Brassica rapa subsp. trilocularis]|uniref:Zinc knuckle CX2CX4HX4C domain-containing protein n=1 Tax=Brassica rapa subsp. trilocularis TaxID=1813537 RepID=A0ABQ7MUE3_BRACM|nr:hypothetical protein IGI04_015706 [Brassica rapa subsp. trilocularis]